jgi:pimeloyl-ACP methyl ester carboxylesterase
MKFRATVVAIILITTVSLVSLNQGCAPGIAAAQPKLDESLLSRGQFRIEDTDLHYVATGQPGKPLVVFVHGTPGSWRAFEHLLGEPALRENLHMVAVDRLGFGESAANGPNPSFVQQARAISSVFALNESGRKVVVVGHSLGGSIGYRLAIDYPQHVGALLAISAAIDPQLSHPRWYNRVAAAPVIRWLVPEALGRANVEMMPLQNELGAMRSSLNHVNMPVTILQGGKDSLVNMANTDFAEQQMTRSDLRVLRYPDTGHFLIWERPELVVDEIFRLVDLAD